MTGDLHADVRRRPAGSDAATESSVSATAEPVPPEVRRRVGAVAIGRNEGERLTLCLTALTAVTQRVVYADSGSTDGSVENARSLGAHVVALTEGPFTAARGRQAATDALLARWPDTGFVMYVDGDCVLRPGFVDAALFEMMRDERLGAVCGRRRESRTSQSFWSRVNDVEWAEPPGPAPYFGGDALCRVEAVVEAGGWNPALIAGEEPDLCFRMRDSRGYGVRRIAVEMTSHDMAMTRFSQYFRRAIRSGHAYAEVGLMHRAGSGRSWFRSALSILAYGCLLPLIGGLGALLHWSIPLVVVTLYARVLMAMVLFVRRRGFPWSLAIAYAALNLCCKLAGALGVATYLWGRVRGRSTPLIEYRAAVAQESVRR